MLGFSIRAFLVSMVILFSLQNLFSQATLPLTRTTWGSTPTGWTESMSTYYSTAFACSGNDGGKFANTNEYTTVNFDSSPDQLSFVVKSNAATTSSLLVEESTNGSSWSTVVSLSTTTDLPTTCTTKGTYSLLSASRYVRWTFTKGTQNMTFDDVSITKLAIPSNSTDYFRSLATGNWNTAGTWQSSSDNSSWNTATLVPTSSAAAITIQSGHVVTINTDVTAPSLTIEGTGELTFDGVAARNISVLGDITISAAGGFFRTQSSGAYTNTMTVGGNISNAGTFDMYRGAGLLCTVTFNKNGNQTVSGAGATTRFGYMGLNMGTSSSNILEISSTNFAAIANFLDPTPGIANLLVNGTLKLSGSYTYSGCFFQPSSATSIVSTAGIWLNNSNVTITGIDDSYELKGLLRVTAGTLNVGTASGNSIKYDNTTTAQFILEGGTVNVAGRFSAASNTRKLIYTQTGGVLTLNTVGSNTAVSKRGVFEILDGSTFTWSAGSIVIQNGCTYYGGYDYYNAAVTPAPNITAGGGTLQIGNGSSALVSEFYLYSAGAIPNLIISSTNSPYVYLFSDINVTGNLTISSGATLDVQTDPAANAYESSNSGTTLYSTSASSNDISVKGNWINDGTFTNRSKTVTFNGTSSQDISGSAETNYYNMTVNNSAGVTITQGPLISNVLTFTAGNITASSSSEPIIIETTGSVSGQADTKCVVGYCQKNTNSTTKFVFPVGSATSYRQMSLTPAGAGATSWNAKYFDEAYSDLTVTDIDHVSNVEYWTLDRSGASPQNATIELSWDANSNADADYSDIVVAHFNGSDWHTAGGNNISGNATAGTVESNSGWSSYSPFTLGSATGIVPLPIELVNFNAKAVKEDVLLTWETATEINNDYFTIERSFDGFHYSPITRVDGAGNSTYIIDYNITDKDYIKGINYYRLIQTDFNGQETKSKVVAVDMSKHSQTKMKTINSLGQEVNEYFSGIVFDVYSDGMIVKRIQ